MRGAKKMILMLCVHWGLEALRLPEQKQLSHQRSEIDAGFGDSELTREEFELMKYNFVPKLNNLHITKPTKPILFIHVHKSLGTWACRVARLAGATAPEGGDCNQLTDGPWHHKDFTFFDNENTCNARQKLNKDNGFNFEEIERHVDFSGGDICPQDMTSAVIFRTPIARIKSQMMANQQTWDLVQNWLKKKEDLAHAHSFIATHIPYDNFYIRTFIERGFFLGSGKITREHLEVAKRNLAKIDVVIDANNLLTQITQLEALAGSEMQQSASKQIHNSNCVDTTKPQCTEYALPADAEKLLKEINALDQEFYEFACKLAKTKTELLGVHKA